MNFYPLIQHNYVALKALSGINTPRRLTLCHLIISFCYNKSLRRGATNLAMLQQSYATQNHFIISILWTHTVLVFLEGKYDTLQGNVSPKCTLVYYWYMCFKEIVHCVINMWLLNVTCFVLWIVVLILTKQIDFHQEMEKKVAQISRKLSELVCYGLTPISPAGEKTSLWRHNVLLHSIYTYFFKYLFATLFWR